MEQTLGKRIVQNRKRLGLTQDQLAEKLGVTAQAVSKWENDQSCPDITMLPRLAEIFGISTDTLLGREESKVHHAEVVGENREKDGFHVQKGNWEFTYDSGRRGALGPAVYVLGFGILLLLSKILQWDVSFWSLLWPWSLVVFGLFAFVKRISFLNVGMLLLGVYFLLDNIGILPFRLGGELVFPGVIVLLGISLLADALKKPKKAKWNLRHAPGKNSNGKGGLNIDGESFSYCCSFGETSQMIMMPCLREGSISTSFGEVTVDLSGVQALKADCEISVNCSFGELTLLVPKRFEVYSNNTTSFADINISGRPEEHPQGMIKIDAHASFGEIVIRYI